MIDPDKAAEILGVAAAYAGGLTTTPATSNGAPSTKREPIDPLPVRVAEEYLRKSDPPDRSKDTYRIACACRDCNLTLENFRWVIDQRSDLADRVGKRHDDDVYRAWERACNEWQARMANAGPPGTPSGPPGTPPPSSGLLPGAFFVRSGGLLVRVLADAVMAAVTCGYGFERFYTYDNGVWSAGSDPIAAEITHLLGNRYRLAHTATALEVIRHTPGLARITNDPLSEFINVPNGMVHWESGTILPHDPAYLSTIQIPVEYTPGADCPKFKQYLAEVLPQDLIDSGFIWELIGYTVFSGNPFQIAIMLHGAGRNGKGTLIRVLKVLLGAANCSSVDLYQLIENKFRVADLLGKLANLAGDLDAKWLENTAMFKKITGEDSVTGEKKYGDSFDFTPWALPFYSTNKPFGSADSSEGWMDRWVVVPFPNTFTGHEDRDLTAKLTSELELRGILAHAIAALPALMGRTGGFVKPQSLADAKKEFILASDSIRAWVDEDCELDPTAWIPRKNLHDAYRGYAGHEGITAIQNREFYNRIGQMAGIRAAIIHGTRGFSGIKLKGQPAQPANFWSAP